MIYNLLLIFLMTFLGSIGAIYLKLTVKDSFMRMLKDKYLYMGGFFYFISALLNIYLLKLIDYTVVLPTTSLTYIWTLLLASKFLNEKITLNKVIGIVLISLGIISIFTI